MESFSATFARDWPLVGAAILFFLAIFSLVFMGLQRANAQSELRRRAHGIKQTGLDGGARSPRASSRKSVEKLTHTITKHFGAVDPIRAKVLRTQLIQAGLYDPAWVPGFFALRFFVCIAAAVTGYVVLPMFVHFASPKNHLMISGSMMLIGYMAPVFWLSKRIKAREQEHRAGFPDFMDLLVVCADAGVSMEAALGRVGEELAESYPSLSANLHLAVLEIRAGKAIGTALEHLGERLSIEEAGTFATLLQQSEELGSSLTEALRVYSDEMRNKRLSRAEEKAYALPAKMVVPLTVFIFPILFVVILLPAVMKISHMQ